MYLQLDKCDLNILDASINKIVKWPYKYPRPKEMPAAIEIAPGRTEPGVPFDFMINYVYEKCMAFLIERFLVGMYKARESLGKEVTAGNSPFQRTVYMYPWELSCTMIATDPDMTIEMAEAIRADRDKWKEAFALEIGRVEIRYHEQRNPNQITPKPAA